MEFKINVDRNRKKITLKYGSMTSVEYDFENETEIGEIVQEFYNVYVK